MEGSLWGGNVLYLDCMNITILLYLSEILPSGGTG